MMKSKKMMDEEMMMDRMGRGMAKADMQEKAMKYGGKVKMACGGMKKKMKAGGMVKKNVDGCATKGKTKCRMV